MLEVTVTDQNKKKVRTAKLSAGWEQPVRKGSVFEAALWQLQGRRRGTASTKERHEVKGSGRKIYRQKGTGNARHGDRQAPIFVGGGVAGGPKPRDWSTSINQKTRRRAVQSALIYKLKNDRLRVLDKLEFKEIKTKQAQALFDKLAINNALLVLDQPNENILKSVRNLPRIGTCSAVSLNVADLLSHEYLVVTEKALGQIEAQWMAVKAVKKEQGA